VPVLARTFEKVGLATVVVTMMPIWSERIGVPRTLAVSFPFGHTLGHAGDSKEQRQVVRAALQCMEEMGEPGAIKELDIEWPDPDFWRRAWQPKQPSPIVKMMRGG